MSLTTAPPETTAVPFAARGPLSEAVLDRLAGGDARADHEEQARAAVARATDVIRDDDIQLALFALYASAYGSIDAFAADLEWDPSLIAARRVLESAFEDALREAVPPPPGAEPEVEAVARALFALTSPTGGPSLARHVAKRATAEQVRELMIHRSAYTLREADPHSWAIPRLDGRAKSALVEIQADEYGAGRPERRHAAIFAATMAGMGLDATYGRYIDAVPALVLASHNAMSMFGLNRRLLGAIVGHLAAFEMTSSIPSRLYADGLRRLGFGEDVTDYFDEHVEADAVHEQIAARDLAGALVADRPDLVEDVMFGAATCVALDDWWGAEVLAAWSEERLSLREPVTR